MSTIASEHPRVAPRTARATWLAPLARAETRRLMRHPALLVFAALSALLATMTAIGPDSGSDDTFRLISVAGFCCLPLGLGTLLASNLNVLRAKRHGTLEVVEATPSTPGQRTTAHLLAVAGPVALAVALTATAWFAVGGANGFALTFTDGARSISLPPVLFLLGPAFVAVMGLAGVMLARLLTNPAAAVIVLAASTPQMISVSWMFEGKGWGLAPLTQPLRVERWIDIPPTQSYPVLSAIASSAMAWHLVYLVGLGVLFAALAVRKHSPTGRAAIAADAGLGITTLGAIAQLNTWTT